MRAGEAEQWNNDITAQCHTTPYAFTHCIDPTKRLHHRLGFRVRAAGSWTISALALYAQRSRRQQQRGTVAHSIQRLWRVVQSLLWPSNSIEVMGGDILIDRHARVVYAYYSRHSLDRVSVQLLLQQINDSSNR